MRSASPQCTSTGVLQQMRAEGLIELSGDRLNIPDWGRLKEVGEFDPTYLHLESDQAAA